MSDDEDATGVDVPGGVFSWLGRSRSLEAAQARLFNAQAAEIETRLGLAHPQVVRSLPEVLGTRFSVLVVGPPWSGKTRAIQRLTMYYRRAAVAVNTLDAEWPDWERCPAGIYLVDGAGPLLEEAEPEGLAKCVALARQRGVSLVLACQDLGQVPPKLLRKALDMVVVSAPLLWRFVQREEFRELLDGAALALNSKEARGDDVAHVNRWGVTTLCRFPPEDDEE